MGEREAEDKIKLSKAEAAEEEKKENEEQAEELKAAADEGKKESLTKSAGELSLVKGVGKWTLAVNTDLLNARAARKKCKREASFLRVEELAKAGKVKESMTSLAANHRSKAETAAREQKDQVISSLQEAVDDARKPIEAVESAAEKARAR